MDGGIAMAPPSRRNIPATRWQPELFTMQRPDLMSSGVLEQHTVLHMPVRLISRARPEKNRPVENKSPYFTTGKTKPSRI